MSVQITRYQEKNKENRFSSGGAHFTVEIDSAVLVDRSISDESRANDEVLLKDRMLEIRAAAVVCNHTQLSRYQSGLHFSAKGGVLMLSGCIPSFYLKQLVQEALRSLEGVWRIENRIAVM